MFGFENKFLIEELQEGKYVLIVVFLIELAILFYHKIKMINENDKEKWIKILIVINKTKKTIKAYGGCFLIIIISLIGFIILLKYTYNDNTDLISSYCSFLSFVGTVMIGYYIYKKERDIEERKRRNTCLRLRNTIRISFINIITFGDVRSEIKKIIYDKNWYQYMVEYIEFSDSEKIIRTHEALTSLFECIDCINKELVDGNYDKAIEVKNNYMEKQKYLPVNYTAVDVINDIEAFDIIQDRGKYDKNEDVIRKIFAADHIKSDDIRGLVVKYGNIIEILIYNDIIKYGKIDVYQTNKKIIDKLNSNENLMFEITDLLGYYSVQVISQVVWKIYDKIYDDINGESDKIRIVDNYYDLK